VSHAERALSLPPAEMLGDREVLSRVLRAIDRAWNELEEARSLADDRVSDALPMVDLVDLALELRRVERRVRRVEEARLRCQLEAVQDAVGRFNGLGSQDNLARECPRAVATLGFDRGVFSRVSDATCTPAFAYSERGRDDMSWLLDSGESFQVAVTPGVAEFDLISRSRCVRVSDTAVGTSIYSTVLGESRAGSFVATRVIAGGRVVGFVHADRGFHDAPVDEVDAAILGIFGEAFGIILSRAIMVEQSSSMRASLSSLASDIDHLAVDLGRSGHAVARPWATAGTGHPAPATDPSATFSYLVSGEDAPFQLTRRETQVIQLLASGASNAEIARGLYIAPETVKSHVRRILRKLSASTRAEAVARWYRDGGHAD
jgi:DNA-binding CsgD family transcriptional regulator